MTSRSTSLLATSALGALVTLLPTLAGCGSSGDSPPDQERVEGQSEFSSSPPVGQGGGGAERGGASAGSSADAPAPQDANRAGSPANRAVEETDLYRLEGDRLYYLNSYRGLMVFDVSNVDAPKLLGRSPVHGTPVEMFVDGGYATVVIGDWYGNGPNGQPFHGSVVRKIDARDPANIKITGEATVPGWARDMRVVGKENLYIVSQDYGWMYGWGYYGGYGGPMGGVASGSAVDVASPYGYGGDSKVVVTSIAFGGNDVKVRTSLEYPGFGGTFNVTSTAIVLAHDVLDADKKLTGKSEIEYLDIRDLDGIIKPKGKIAVDGSLQGWGADNGRWNLDFDGRHAYVLTCGDSGRAGYWGCDSGGTFKLSIVDFQNEAAPTMASTLDIASKGWAATARFSDKRMYLSPREGYWSNGGQSPTTPVEVYDVSNPAAPALAGSTSIDGAVWLFIPAGDRLFALGNNYVNGASSSQVALRYLDVSNPASPQLLGNASFGEGWAWTPAAGTFKAFTRDAAQGLVVLPFSGWSSQSYEYNNGLQLIDVTPTSITSRGAAKSKGWVERGILVKNRLVSLSDMSLSVVDYTNRAAPRVVHEQALARNVIDAQPDGANITQLSTDWWGYDQTKSELRVLPIANAEELHDEPAAAGVQIDGTNARVFRNGSFAYVYSMKYPNPSTNGGRYEPQPQVQVVDLSSGKPVLRDKLDLPVQPYGYWSWWGGCYYWDWYDGSNAQQIGGDVLAFRQSRGTYDPQTKKTHYEQNLQVVDLSNPDAPRLSSAVVTQDPRSWWGNMRVVGSTLYTTHYDWVRDGKWDSTTGKMIEPPIVRYFMDEVDLSDRNNPKIGARINVPGMLVGASSADPSMLYFVDYRWYGSDAKDEIAVAKRVGNRVFLQSSTLIDGWVGNVIVRGTKAYMSAQEYVQPSQPNTAGQPTIKLHELDLGDPKAPVDRASAPKDGWGWLLDVEGDRAIVTSGWGQVGFDIYRLQAGGAAPTYDQFARTRGWWPNAISRQGNALFVSSGYWGVQKIGLQ